MIFVTVGTQLAFDRLTRAVDQWAALNPQESIVGQIGPGTYLPTCFKHQAFVSPSEANALFSSADFIVAHAGMGSILSALRYRRPILIMPRRAALGEHRNDHQLATARWLGGRPGVHVAADERELLVLLDRRKTLVAGGEISEFAPPAFTDRIRRAVIGE